MGESNRALKALNKMGQIVKEANSEISSDYVTIQELMETLYLLETDIENAKIHFKKALAAYEILWASDPDMIEAKYQEIYNLYPQAGIAIAQKFLQNCKEKIR